MVWSKHVDMVAGPYLVPEKHPFPGHTAPIYFLQARCEQLDTMHTHLHTLFTHIHTGTFTCICIPTCTHTYRHIHTYGHVCTYIHRTCTCIFMYTTCTLEPVSPELGGRYPQHCSTLDQEAGYQGVLYLET